MLDNAGDLVPLLVALAALLAVLWAGARYLRHRYVSGETVHVRAQFGYIVAVSLAVVAVIITLPVEGDVRNALLSLFGLLITAVIGLAATTHVGNALAGLMLRSRRAFKPGDFLRAEDQFGRVVRVGLFHTEIQTEDRDITSLPNVLLATRPFTVVDSSGTVVSATVSLGYDEPRGRVQELLTEAAAEAGLEEPFVQITDLGDFSVTYRVGGLLRNPTTLLTARSSLRSQMLDHLHRGGIEIVSPAFMNQRQIGAEAVMPPLTAPAASDAAGDIESIAFDKAENAASLERMREQRAAVDRRIDELKDDLSGATGEAADALRLRIERLEQRRDALDGRLAEADGS